MSKVSSIELKRFQALFRGLGRTHGVYDPRTKKSYTKHQPISEGEWLGHLKGAQGIGVCPILDDNKSVVFAALDVDNHKGQEKDESFDFRVVEAKAAVLDLPLVVCRSKRGGAHCYLFLTEPAPAKTVVQKLKEYAALLGYSGCEIFPKQYALEENSTSFGNWINFPYFGDGGRYAVKGGEELSLAAFLDYAEGMKVDPKRLKKSATKDMLDDGPPCLNILLKQGVVEGLRNQVLFNVGVYLNKKFPDINMFTEELERVNDEKFDPPLSGREVASVIYSVTRKKDYFYTCSQAPLCDACDKSECRKRPYGIKPGDKHFAQLSYGTLSKITTDPPLWEFQVNDSYIRVSTDDLMDVSRFRKKCMEVLTMLPPSLRRDDWEQMIAARMENVKIIEAPEDASAKGQMRIKLNDFLLLSERGTKNMQDLLHGIPVLQEGRYYFRSQDFTKYLNTQRVMPRKQEELWVMLSDIGCTHESLTVKGKAIEAWVFGGELNRQTENFEIQKESTVL